MDKNAIKKYAVWARRELISRVSQKALQYGISEKETVPASAASVNGVVLSAEEIKQRKALIDQINAKGYEQVMEEVAYTWFNRFIALRFMEVNGYLPSHVRVFTDEDNAFRPQIITEAINLELDGLDMDKVYAWKDANDNDSLFKYLIITQCNALSPILPRMFQRIADYTELLFPDNLLREGSAIQQMIELIPEDDWKDAVQIIGWLYQFYNIEPKAEVFAKNGKISKEEIPAATQLFTPDWIVRYMVENSLGRLWVEGHPNDSLKAQWKYYLDEAEQEPDVQTHLAAIRREYAAMAPEQIKCIDPCAGSGHILAYMFDVLVQIYEDYGYSVREAVRGIIENNLYGLDIDDRAAQLAYFAVMMKARQYDRRFFARKDENGNPDVPQPHVYTIVESNGMDAFALDYFINGDAELKKAMDSIIKEMQDAKEYGSILKITPVDFSALYARFDEVRDDVHLSREVVLDTILPLVQVAEVMAQKYATVVTNPPYMSVGAAGPKLSTFVAKNYPDSKSDMFAVFIEQCRSMLQPNGYQAMITMHAWMFLSSFEKLRMKLLTTDTINMAHLGARAFEEIGGEVVQTTAFVMRKSNTQGYMGTYLRLVDPTSQVGKENLFLERSTVYTSSIDNFKKIPGFSFAYWLSNNFINLLSQDKTIGKSHESGSGLSTADNERFLRFFWEVDRSKIADGKYDQKKWYLFHKGGEYRKWYGNLFYVVNWENDGAEIKYWVTHNPKDPNTTSWSRRIFNTHLYFERGITWSVISSGDTSFRVIDTNAMISNAAGGIFGFADDEQRDKFMAAINSKVWTKLFATINPTINYSSGVIQKAPLPVLVDSYLGSECVAISKSDWDSFETSWDFAEHPMVRLSRDLWDATAIGASMHYYYGCHPKVSGPLELCYMLWQGECQERFKQLKENEEELNRIFIDIYGLQDELTPDVEDKDVTVRLADKKRDIKSLISYAVGCMFGRYSLDVPGLAYAGGEWDDSKYTTFKADKDSIIPICDDEYFADDIVGRFIRFIEVVYGKETLQENLRFIADALGGSGQPKDVIRNYFLNDFYTDHLKVYQKRPIYWLFDSGKKNGFKALVYMHRYQPDTIARMRTDYVHEQQARYRTAIADLEQRISSASTAERVKLSKRLKQLQEQATEIQSYEEKIHHLADQYIAIDLDDGVKKNYAIFGDVLAKIK